MARTFIRLPQATDQAELIALNQSSRELHADWAAPPSTAEAFQWYLERSQRPDTCAMLLCHATTKAVMGMITLSQIFYGPLQSAYMGYSIGAAYARQGFMREGIAHMLDHAFEILKLHRIEANIQPDNQPSIRLIERLGFTREGFSRRYLFIAGQWRDHARYAMLSEDWPTIRTTIW
ncbi:MAG: hypothetical protein Fur005_49390 [Roseiflexaceae bacterium]